MTWCGRRTQTSRPTSNGPDTLAQGRRLCDTPPERLQPLLGKIRSEGHYEIAVLSIEHICPDRMDEVEQFEHDRAGR